MPTLWMTSAFVALSAIPPVFVYVLQCTPIHSLWSEVGPGEKVVCLNFKAGTSQLFRRASGCRKLTMTAIIVFGIINIASDIFILSLPIPVVWGLQLDKRTKLSVCALFLVGSVVCVISVVRLVYAKNVETADPTCKSALHGVMLLVNIYAGDLTTIAILSTLEASAAVMVACMPTWRPLFRFLGRGITSYFNGSSKNGKGDDTQNLKYGNNMPIGGRGRWSGMPPRMSITDKEHTASGAKGSRLSYILGQKRSETSMSGESVEKMLHGQEIELELSNSDSKTSPSIAASDTKTRTSSGSLRAPAPPPRSSSIRAPSPVVTFGQHSNATAGHSRKQGSGKTMGYSPPRDVPDLTFSSASSDYAYKASVGADRWESLMKQQQIKNKAKENGNRHSGERLKDKKKALYGEVAYGGAAGSRADGGEEEGDGRLNGGLGLGMGHISVTRTVVNVSSEGK
jgi:hypothetical protein